MASSSRAFWLGTPIVVALIAGGVWWIKQRPQAPDMIKAIDANNRGIGYMEQFAYKEAVPEFEEVARLAPDWLPGRINLGIALLNRDQSTFDRPIAIFEQVLKEDPANNYADFCLGIMLEHQSRELTRAAEHFEAVTKRDPDDPHAWLFLGNLMMQLDDAKRATMCYEKALAADPYLTAAFYGLQAQYRRLGEEKKANELLDRFKRLNEVVWNSPAAKKYAEMGKYAEVIGRNPRESAPTTGPLPIFLRDDKLHVQLRKGARWATSAKFSGGYEGDLPGLLRTVRKRFGGSMVAFDVNGDGKLDLFLAGAVLEGIQLKDLLLVNDGDGKFRDVTVEAGLSGEFKTIGCTVADFDNDGLPDLLLTGTTGVRLLRNSGGGKEVRFEDVTKAAGLDQLQGVCAGAAFVDLDQDSDLDLVVAVLGVDATAALQALQTSPSSAKGGGVAMFLNIGEAPPNPVPSKRMALKAKFRQASELFPNNLPPTHNFAVSDVDGDRDVDVLCFGDRETPSAILNDRLLKFHRGSLPAKVLPKGHWNGTAILDVNRDNKSDLFVVGPGQKPALLVHGKAGTDSWFTAGVTNAPPMIQAHAVDIDLDGWTDIVGLTDERKPVLLHNQNGKLVHVADALGAVSDWPADIAALVPADLDNRCHVDFVLWSEKEGLRLYRSQKNGNHALPVQLIGRLGIDAGGLPVRCNNDGIGTRIGVQVRDHWTCAESATFHAGLGQSRQPILFGLAKHDHADFVSLRWPDGVWQAELNVAARKLAKLAETNRKTTSCPILFTWNGRQFEYITDFLGAGSLGEPLPGGGHRRPRPEESLKIEAHQLQPKDGRYVLKFAEPMDEATYLDRLRLVVVDHPADVRVYPDERFPLESRPATQDLIAFSTKAQVFPKVAKDHRGRDLTETLRHWDRRTADGIAKRAWIGFAEEHWVELDFGDRLAQFGPKEPLGLFLAGWTDYPFPESIWAASQAGISLLAPMLERLGPDGQWQVLRDDLSFPAGLPRMMTYDLTGLMTGPTCKLRLRTNMHVYWDQIFVAPITARVPHDAIGRKTNNSSIMKPHALDVAHARLEHRGCPQEFSPDGRQPTVYAYDRLDQVPITRQAGILTKFGDVTELLTRRDDRFVIFAANDELTVTFAADKLPPLPASWTRSFVLQTWGYCKDASPFTTTGDTIEPLPFHGMSGFPYGPNERHPDDNYRRLWNTRQVGR